MFQDNPLLAQLKEKLHAQTPRVEGVVKSTDKGFGFLEVDSQKSYFIPPSQMKKVMHGDRIVAVLQTDRERDVAEPEKLIEPFLSRFVGRIQKKEGRFCIIPDHPLLKESILCRAAGGLKHNFQVNDWAVAEMRRHPLKGDRGFYAELTEYITAGNDPFAPWWVTLSHHNLERLPPMEEPGEILDEGLQREDLTALEFVTIDSASTEDIDDALYVCETPEGELQLTIAIADPTAWIAEGSTLDLIAASRAFTNYLPGFNIPMLPRELSDDRCSLRLHQRRPVLACRVTVSKEGELRDDMHFFTAWIESKARLIYDDVSDWLENTGSWQPQSDAIANQIMLLHRLCLSRTAWRQTHALVFKERSDYVFLLDDNAEVLDIIAESRRISNRIVEEAMITANICAAEVLQNKLGFGIYNVHSGFEYVNADQACSLLASHGIQTTPATLMTLEGYCALRRQLDSLPTSFLDNRIRRFLSFGGMSTRPEPHFGLGLKAYATWTSPIRKYGDMVNHRLLKAIICGKDARRPSEEITLKMAERRRLYRLAERDVSSWLYARFLQKMAGGDKRFSGEIIDISRGGMRLRLAENGAVVFVPASFLHAVRDEMVCSPENGTIEIKGQLAYRVSDTVDVTLAEVRMETRSIVARPAA